MLPRMRLLGGAFVLLLVAVAFAGCLEEPFPVGDAEAAHSGVDCPTGTAVVGFLADGKPRCAVGLGGPVAYGAFMCPPGEFVRAFDASGMPICAAPQLDRTPPSPTADFSREVASNLKLTGIYGVRNSTSDDLWDIKMNIELSAGALPMDVTKFVIRYSDGSITRNYGHSAAALPDAARGTMAFNATWIRGEGGNFVMQAGDLVEIHMNLVSAELGTRTPVEISLIPETGSPVAADFKTPATYWTDTTITLR